VDAPVVQAVWTGVHAPPAGAAQRLMNKRLPTSFLATRISFAVGPTPLDRDEEIIQRVLIGL
jgi:hypothetical protein